MHRPPGTMPCSVHVWWHTQQLSPAYQQQSSQNWVTCGRERGVVVGGCRSYSLVAEHWQLKPEVPGSIPGGTAFLSFPLPFERSMDSNGPDNLYWSSDLGEPHLSGSLCCDKLIRFFCNHKHTGNVTYISTCVMEVNTKSDYIIIYIYQLLGKPHMHVLVPK